MTIRSVVSLSAIKTPQSRRGFFFRPSHIILGGRLLSYLFSHPTSLAKATARSKISCRSASPKENTLFTSVNLGLPKGRRYPLSEPSFRGRPNRSSAARGPPGEPATATDPPPHHHTQPAPPHPAASHLGATTKQNRHEPHCPPCTNPTTPPTASRGIHPKKRDPQGRTRPSPTDTPPALPIQPAKALTRPHVTTATNTHHGFEPIQTSPTPTHGSSRTLSMTIRSVVSLSAIKTPQSRRGFFF